jgi:hypothetical protein
MFFHMIFFMESLKTSGQVPTFTDKCAHEKPEKPWGLLFGPFTARVKGD